MKSTNNIGSSYVELSGSLKDAPIAPKSGQLNKEDVMEVTIRVRRKKSIEPALGSNTILTRSQYEKTYGSSTADMEKVDAFVQQHHLSVVESSTARRSVIVRGKVKDFEEAFKVSLSSYQSAEGEFFRGRSGGIHIPKKLQDIIEGVFGLDNRPNATPKFQVATPPAGGAFQPHAATPTSFRPDTIGKLYGFPQNVTGKGECIAIIELGGGFRTVDIKNYFAGLGIPKPVVKSKSVDGGHNSPSNANSADGEVMLDIEVAGAVAPGAKIVVYFAPNSDQGFLDAITTAIHDNVNKPSVISISWGSAEKNWTAQSLNSFNEAFKAASLLGVTVCAAAGDQGSSDNVTDGKVHVDFPSSSPYVLACGGTKLLAENNQVSSETVWHVSNSSATGGGVSEVFPLPSYQQGKGVPASLNPPHFVGRGVPDVAGDADPNTGYQVLVDGQQMQIGGTSAVAPLMAAFIALVNQLKGTKAGFIHPTIYANPTQFCRDITVGDNKTTASHSGYSAGIGWDACTGLGVLSKL